MKNWIGCFFFCTNLIFGAEFHLKQRLEQAHCGDYIVTQADQIITVLTIRSINDHSLIFEEISAPLKTLKKLPDSWPAWVQAKAPGHTSWSMAEIDLESGQIIECYSFSRRTWVRLAQNESLVATLIHLPLQQIPPHLRRKIGPPPLNDEPDFRKIWNPPLIREGQKVENASFEVYTTTWPEDGSELSNKQVALYFDQENQFALPFWIQLETAHASASVRTIDSGRNLPLVYREMPRRNPEFIGSPQKTKNGLRFLLKSPKYYQEFELFAVDTTTKDKKITPIPHSLGLGGEEWLHLEVDQEELEQILQPNHRYTWLLVPVGHNSSYIESVKPFVWPLNH